MALDSYLYRDPMLIVQEKQERELLRRRKRETRELTEDQSNEIEDLLRIWYEWNRTYGLALGAPRAAPYARETPPEKGNVHDDAEIVEERINQDIASAVEWCLDALPEQKYRSAVGLTMANKYGPSVFRSNRYSLEERHEIYQEAKRLLMPLLRRRELMRT